MVKAAKKAIYAIVGERDVNDEELITVFTGVESLLNSRPLTYQSSDPRDGVPLTPNHFLHGQMGDSSHPSPLKLLAIHYSQNVVRGFSILVCIGVQVFFRGFFNFSLLLSHVTRSRVRLALGSV